GACNMSDTRGCHELQSGSTPPTAMTPDTFRTSNVNGNNSTSIVNTPGNSSASTGNSTAFQNYNADGTAAPPGAQPGAGGFNETTTTVAGPNGPTVTTVDRLSDGSTVSSTTTGVGANALTSDPTVTLSSRSAEDRFNAGSVRDSSDSDCKTSSGV